MMWVTIGAILVSIVTALIGLLTQDIEQKNKLFAISAKSILVCALAFVVGFGACLGSI
ncbi:MAG: hypothetical protein KGV51_05630 [Moraxellaceae bacterium]|nr:hypothetical protein [Moraxellaceae bacterium]